MAKPCQRKRAKSGLKVSRKPHAINLRKIVVSEPTIQSAWDPTRTVHENFRSIGLADRLNGELGSAALRRRVGVWEEKRERSREECDIIRREAAQKAAEQNVLDMTPLDLGEEAVFGQLNQLFDSQTPVGEENSVVSALKEKSRIGASEVKPRTQKLTEFESLYVAALVDKYGASNISSMARDIKLNFLQHTPKRLESLLSIYKASN